MFEGKFYFFISRPSAKDSAHLCIRTAIIKVIQVVLSFIIPSAKPSKKLCILSAISNKNAVEDF